ncbi:MAG: CBS domain-containing protein [Nitrospirota bacterium]|nr:CBS domain-containing protein [Nitrospirota bacterium]
MEKGKNKDNLSPDISDDDIFEAMKDIQGYIDITPADLKEIFRCAYRHATERLSRSVKAADIMSRAVYFVRTHTPLRDVAEIMAEKKISGVPVLDNAESVVGIISEKDFLVHMGSSDTAHVMGIISACLEGKGCLAAPIRSKKASDIMASPAITVHEESSAFEIIDLFNNKNINRVPVVDRSGKLTGIVSRADILRAQMIKGQ